MPPCYFLNNSVKINQFNFFCYKESEKTLLQKPVYPEKFKSHFSDITAT